MNDRVTLALLLAVAVVAPAAGQKKLGPLTIKELARQIVLSKTFRYKLAQVAP